MSVASKNPFAVLEAEENSVSATPAPAAQKTAQSAPAPKTQQKPRAANSARGGKYYARGGKPTSNEGSAAVGTEEPAGEGRKFDGSRGRGGRGGRGRGAPAGGKGRQYDRHSATGKTDSHKKVHQGWGGDEGNTELKAERAAAADAAAEPAAAADWGVSDTTAAADWGAPADGENAAPPAEADDKAESKPRREREEEEDNTLTLEQYLSKQKEKETLVPKLEGVRKANEGTTDDIWKNTVQLAKNEEEETYFAGKTKAAPKQKAKKDEKVFLEIDARFERPDRGTGRGRGRGERGRGAPRGNAPRGRGPRQQAVSTPNVEDQSAFPSLA